MNDAPPVTSTCFSVQNVSAGFTLFRASSVFLPGCNLPCDPNKFFEFFDSIIAARCFFRGNAQLFQPAINETQHRSRLVRDLLDLFGGSPRLLVSNLLENGALTLRDLKALQNAARMDKNGRTRGGKRA